MITTYSFWNAFRNCRKACEWRYVRELVPIGRDQALSFGTLIHTCLEMWHNGRGLEAVLDFIDASLPNRAQDEPERSDWHLARAMMTGYAARYSSEDFDVVALEKTFDGVITNPATDAPSRSFTIAGKVDGIVRTRATGEHYLLEHKTASQVDGDYLEKLWTDLQISAVRALHRASTRYPHRGRHLQRARQSEAPAGQGRDRGRVRRPPG